jgi:hypothetical protein
MLHSVKPNASSFGCLLYKNTLKYCNTYRNTHVWLIGDSANAYPPGQSLERNLKATIDIMPTFYNYYLTNDVGDESTHIINAANFNCDALIQKIKLRKNCLAENYEFSGGYLKGHPQNYTITQFNNIVKSIEQHSCGRDSAASEYQAFYNQAMFLSFVSNINDVLCKQRKNKPKNLARLYQRPIILGRQNTIHRIPSLHGTSNGGRRKKPRVKKTL